MEMDGSDFLYELAEDLSSEIRRSGRLRTLLAKDKNKNCFIGAFAEATVRQLVLRTVAPLRVCHGGVIDHDIINHLDGVRQLDTVIWSPCPVPAMYSVGDFGLVPRGSAFGILEIKASMYSDIGTKMKWLLAGERAYELTTPFRNDNIYPALGVVCIKFNGTYDTVFDGLVNQKRAVILFRENAAGELIVDTEGVCTLMNFLAATRRRAKITDGEFFIPMAAIKKSDGGG